MNNLSIAQAAQLPVDKLRPFEGHPFQVKDDAEMEQLVHSILTHGLLTPISVRPIENNEYEVISGHRRLHACKKAGIETVPALIYALDRDAATIAMVDSNLHREKILPSEKAFAYKMKRDALSHQGKTSPQLGEKLYLDGLTHLASACKQRLSHWVGSSPGGGCCPPAQWLRHPDPYP